MVRKVTLQRVDELTNKFQLQDIESAPRPWLMSEMVVPVTNIDEMALSPQTIQLTISVTSAATYALNSIPVGETWRIRGIYLQLSTGVYTFDAWGVRVIRATPAPVITLLDIRAAGVTELGTLLAQDLVLRSTDELTIRVNGYTSSGTLNVRLYYTKSSTI